MRVTKYVLETEIRKNRMWAHRTIPIWLENSGLHILLKMGLPMMENGSAILEMVTESNSGLTGLATRVSGMRIWHMAKVKKCSLMVMYMRASGLMIRLMV